MTDFQEQAGQYLRAHEGHPPRAGLGRGADAHLALELPAAKHRPATRPLQGAPQDGDAEAVQRTGETHDLPDRFGSPLIQEIVETWRARQDMVRAQSKLTLQAKAICRRFTEGDKTEAGKLYASILNGGAHPLAAHAGIAVLALRAASQPLEEHRGAYEKHLAKLGEGLPIAHMADRIKGINTKTLAVIVAEIGDLSAYERGSAGIWKRAGLAVIDGERQRKASGDAALLHGYSPERRSVFWNIGAALLKAQGKDENAGPYRRIYDERKAYERPRVESDGHAHNRALRYMTKRLLRDLWREWVRVAKEPAHA